MIEFKGFKERFEGLLNQEGIKNLKDFSNLSGIPYSTLTNSINREAMPKLDTLEKIADFFGVTIDYLATGRPPWDAKKIIDKREKSGLIIEGHKVAEDTELYKAVKRLMDVPEADIAKVRQVLDLIQSVAREKQKVKKPPLKAGNEG